MSNANKLTIKPKPERFFLILTMQILANSIGGWIGGGIGGLIIGVGMVSLKVAFGGAIGGAIGGCVAGVFSGYKLIHTPFELENQIISGIGKFWRIERFHVLEVKEILVNNNILGSYQLVAKDGRKIFLPRLAYTENQLGQIAEAVKNAQKN